MKPFAVRSAAVLLVASCLLPAPAFADQFQWITAEQAETAQAKVAEVGVIRHFCPGCGDTLSRPERIEAVEIAPVPDGDGYWNVLVNGDAVDLAYVYVPHDGAWRNLALLLELDASDVPTKLERGQLRADQKGLD
jgi:hypothetical protein